MTLVFQQRYQAIIEAFIQRREDMPASIPRPFPEANVQACVRTPNGSLQKLQWCRTEEEARDWIREQLSLT